MPGLIIVAAALPGFVALGVCAYQLSLPNVLFGYHYSTGNPYDDGVYMGAALHLVNGVLPYRDFVLLHPPGVPLLMSPLAALGRVIGTRDALVGARLVTVLVTGLNAVLAAIAVRHRGVGAMLMAGTALACFPLAVAADQSLLLEPYLVCFCLIGVVAMFSGGEPPPPATLCWLASPSVLPVPSRYGRSFPSWWRLPSACRDGKTFERLCLARSRGSLFLACRFSSLLRMLSSTMCS